MTKLEKRRFLALVNKLEKESAKLNKTAHKEYKKAGCSGEDGGTGDEGWSRVFTLGGLADGLGSAAADIRQLVESLDGGNHQRSTTR